MYRQIAEDLRAQIETGELAPGARLPTEDELRTRYSASRNTIRDAVKLLTARRLVETRPGQGTFVTLKIEPIVVNLGAAADHSAAMLGTSELPTSPAMESTPPRIEIQLASELVSAELRLPEGEQVVSRHQAQFISSVPWSLQTSFYPMHLVRNGATRLLAPNAIPEGTVQYLRDELGLTQVSWRDRLAIRPADANENAFFNLPPDGRVSIAEVARTTFDRTGAPMRLTVSAFPVDRNQFIITSGEMAVPALEGPAAGAPNPAGRVVAGDRTSAIFALER